MNERLQQVIEYKAGGVQTVFCALLGWSPQYLGKLLKGRNFGLAPVLTIVKAFPELNARWFLTGDGEMLSNDGVDSCRAAVRDHVDQVLEMEKYIPVMSPAELRSFEDALYGKKPASFPQHLIDVWELRLSQRKESLSARVRAAQVKSDELCKQQEVRK